VILDGQKKTGTTIFLLDEKLDHGPILAQAELSLDERETSQSLSQKLAELSRNLLLKTLPLWLQGELKPKPQNHRQATYTRLIQKEDGYLPLETLNSLDPKTIRQIERKIRAFYPWPKVWTEIKGERVLIHQAHLENGRLVLEIVQPAGKKPMPYQEYLKGHPPLIQAEQSEKMTLSRNKK
jgi:methionyl-tRNA formyltransferase